MKHLMLATCLFVFNILLSQDNTYTLGTTTYEVNATYTTTGNPKVVRSEKNKKDFLKSLGYNKLPYGYEIDHIIPLSEGGTDDPSNMQLLTIEEHKKKTANERSRKSNKSKTRSKNYTTTTTMPEYKPIYNPSLSDYTPTCGALTTKGTYCKRKVKDGGRCSSHR